MQFPVLFDNESLLRNYRSFFSNCTAPISNDEWLVLEMQFVPTILCVDDDEDDLFFVQEAIQSHPGGFAIEQARNGWEAYNFLMKCVQKEQLPCLVIMDINMPRMNGRQTILKIRETDSLAAIPIAVFTTSSNQADRRFFEGLGVHFITKPFDYQVFRQEILRLLSTHGPLNR